MTVLLAFCICPLLQIPSYGLDACFMNIKTDGRVTLYSKEETSGNAQAVKSWLISTNCDDRNKPGEVFMQRAEPGRKMEYIKESIPNLNKKEGIMITCKGEKQIVHHQINLKVFFNY